MILAGTPASPSVTYSVLHEFADGSVTDDGAYPSGSLVDDENGHFFGVTIFGGSATYGAVFQYDESTGDVTIIHHFSDGNYSNDGAYPVGGLVMDHSGNLYGTTEWGGTSDNGTIFKLEPSSGSWNYSVLYSFPGGSTDGGAPCATMIIGTDGKLYGTTGMGGANGGGTVFRFDLGNTTLTTIASLPSSGYLQTNGVTQSPDAITNGNILEFWGTVALGGVNSKGRIYKVTETSTGSGVFSYSVVHDFAANGSEGAMPYGNLCGIPGFAGFYGTTSAGGGAGQGALFKITVGGTFTELSSGGSWATGSIYGGPAHGVIYTDLNGSIVLLGACAYGGANGYGSVFEVYLQ